MKINRDAVKLLYNQQCWLILIILFLTSLGIVDLNGQTSQIRFEHLSVIDGLSGEFVWRVRQDNQGFMWFATANGLNRYDGYNFTIFRNEGIGSISHDDIWSLFEDRAGILWVGTCGGGLNKFDRKKQRFTHYDLYDSRNLKSLSNQNKVRVIHESPFEPGILWIGTFGGIIRFDTKSDSMTRYIHDPGQPQGLPDNLINHICEDREGFLWFGTYKGLCRLNPKEISRPGSDLILTIYNYDPDVPSSISSNIVYTIMEDKSGVLWIGTGNGLNKMNRELGTFNHYKHDENNPTSLSDNKVTAILEDRDEELWIGTYNGLNRMIRKKGVTPAFIRYEYFPHDRESLSNNRVWSIYEDKSGILWVATLGGLNKIHKKPFIPYRYQTNNPNGLIPMNIEAIYVDKSLNETVLWLGNISGGITQIIRKKEKLDTFKYFQYDSDIINSLSRNHVKSIHGDKFKPGVYWIGTYNKGLNRLNARTGRFKHFEFPGANLTGPSLKIVFTFHQSLNDPDLLWIGGMEGLFQMRRGPSNTETFTHFPIKSKTLNGREVFSVHSIHESPNHPGVIWVGSHKKGLFRLSPSEGNIEKFNRTGRIRGNKIEDYEVEQYLHQPGNPTSLIDDRVLTICETNDGNLWIGTKRGMSKLVLNTETDFKKKKITFTSYDETDGLPNNEINGILEDQQGNLWISTKLGISKYNPVTDIFLNYLESDGLQSNQFLFGSYFKTADGMMYFGGTGGLNMFHPDKIKDNSIIPPIVFTDFQVNHKSVPINPDRPESGFILNNHIGEIDEIILPFNERIFSFEFAALDFTDPEKNKYAYKMEGVNKNWVHSGRKNSADYTHLPPGEYIFRVKGAKSNGIWNEEGISIKIRILPPWYLTWWAYILYFLSFSGIVLGVRQYERNRRNHKLLAQLKNVEAEKLMKIDKAKSHFFANISHEFRTPLTLILGQIESEISYVNQKRDTDKLRMAQRNARKLQVMINQLLDLSKIESGQMNLMMSEENIVPFLKKITGVFESQALQRGIKLQFDTAETDIMVNFEREKMEKVMYNLISNALKFTQQGGNINVTVEKQIKSSSSFGSGDEIKGDMIIMVRDNGIGIQEDQLPYIFDRFYQVDTTNTRKFEGTGIGLALTMELLQLHSGGVSVESEVGSGTIFTVRLPLGSGHLKPEQMRNRDALLDYEPDLDETGMELEGPVLSGSESKISIKKNTRNTRKGQRDEIILIVEDNSDMRSFISDSLASSYQVLEAAEGMSGFKLAKEHIPDLIITDVMMPGTDGYELTGLIRSDRLTCHIPVIMLTAKAAEEDKYTGFEKGVDAYLTKPFNSKELQIRVRKLIEIRHLAQMQKGSSGLLEPEDIEICSMDEQFLRSINEYINKNLENRDLNVEDLAAHTFISGRQLQRKLKALTGMSAIQCVRKLRLFRARKLLEKGAGTVSQVVFLVGYTEFSSFSRAFKEEFGLSPSAVKPVQ